MCSFHVTDTQISLKEKKTDTWKSFSSRLIFHLENGKQSITNIKRKKEGTKADV